MIVKLKCIDNAESEGYLTVGKIYNGIIDSDDNFAIIDDEGDLINDSMTYELHAKWELLGE